MRNIKMILEYDGGAYSGWQRQLNGLSIQQVLEEAIGRMTGEAIRVHGSGRTDAGVHALGQCAHFHTRSGLPERSLLMGINSLLPSDIAVLELADAPLAFHARYDAQSKAYLYRICNRPVRSALERGHAWFIWTPLDLTAIREALPVFLGTHDFTSFCSTHTDSPDHIRTILSLTAEKDPSGMIAISVEANGFLRYMVRTLVGALVDAGRGKASPADLAAVLAAKDRRLAGLTAPPQGLYLKDVKYA
ncbi:MAG: tRNA pseudouridine(38-40) synthase TruA [Deltaproteobacteria bacterium]|nr:tRNA pseudouridine(38-40) synthase TruA [Deltaproteobacteria bacterium]